MGGTSDLLLVEGKSVEVRQLLFGHETGRYINRCLHGLCGVEFRLSCQPESASIIQRAPAAPGLVSMGAREIPSNRTRFGTAVIWFHGCGVL